MNQMRRDQAASREPAAASAALPSGAFALSSTELAAYERDGFIVRRGDVSSERLEPVLRAAERIVTCASSLPPGTHEVGGTQFVIKGTEHGNSIARIVWAGGKEPELLAVSREPQILRPVRDILHTEGTAPFLADQLINSLHVKLPHDTVFFPWHQDIRHRQNRDPNWRDVNGRGSFVQTMLAIDPMSAANGGVIMIAGSHRFGSLNLAYAAGSKTLTDEVLPAEVRDLPRIPVELRPGDLVFFHPLVVHGSNPNEGGARRLALVSGFAFPGANTAQYPGEGSGERVALP